MNNEAILNKLVELGRLSIYSDDEYGDAIMSVDGEIEYCTRALFNLERDDIFLVIQDALVSACGGKGYDIYISENQVLVSESAEGAFGIFEGEYSRLAVIEAFCKVTNITGE